ncbi:MAG: PLP-dependent aminotransferase family protein, partial [Chloroflexi bacterium]|nr:PLP-dependent aminotransferase family protein [Chloroflexota bacterium]
MRIPLDRDGPMPLYEQIKSFLAQQIRAGTLAPEARLPASRHLADSLGVSRMTVINAYAELEAEGLVYSMHGSGTFVAAPIEMLGNGRSHPPTDQWPIWQENLAQNALVRLKEPYETAIDKANHPSMIQFTSGMGTTDIFSTEGFRKTLQAVLRRDGAKAMGYGDTEHGGYEPLRTTIAHILGSEGIPARPDDVLITSGSQQAIAVVARLLLRPGDTILVENPTYEGGLDLFRGLGARLVGIPMDDEGMRMDMLEEALRTARPCMIYTIPTFHNPTGISMSTRRRQELVTLAHHYNVPIVEDDFAGELRYEGHTQPALKALDRHHNVIYVNTFSKALVPGLRIGYLVASGPVFEQLIIHKRNEDRSSSDLMQRALDAYITVGKYQAHLRKVGRTYRKRRNAMLNALHKYMPPGVTWIKPFGGLFLWL